MCVCIFVSICLWLHLCVCVVCVYKCDWEVVSVCLDLLVILAWLFRGNKKVRRRREGGGKWQDWAIVLKRAAVCGERERLKEGRMKGCSFCLNWRRGSKTWTCQKGRAEYRVSQGAVNILLTLYSGFTGYMISISELDLAEYSPMKQETCNSKSLSLSHAHMYRPTHDHTQAHRYHPLSPPLRHLWNLITDQYLVVLWLLGKGLTHWWLSGC